MIFSITTSKTSLHAARINELADSKRVSYKNFFWIDLDLFAQLIIQTNAYNSIYPNRPRI